MACNSCNPPLKKTKQYHTEYYITDVNILYQIVCGSIKTIWLISAFGRNPSRVPCPENRSWYWLKEQMMPGSVREHTVRGQELDFITHIHSKLKSKKRDDRRGWRYREQISSEMSRFNPEALLLFRYHFKIKFFFFFCVSLSYFSQYILHRSVSLFPHVFCEVHYCRTNITWGGIQK